jgi:hypothetical protein
MTTVCFAKLTAATTAKSKVYTMCGECNNNNDRVPTIYFWGGTRPVRLEADSGQATRECVIGWVDELLVGNEWHWYKEEDRVCLVLNLSRLLSLAAEGQICDLCGMGKERPTRWGSIARPC